MLYFAYGSNLDYSRMFSRCKKARVVGKATLLNYRLCFMENNSKRIVANIEETKGNIVYGVLYDINKSDLAKLDICEGYPNVYQRKLIDIDYKGDKVKTYVYIMDKVCDVKNKYFVCKFVRDYGSPSKDYFNHIVVGYSMFDLPQNSLMEAYIYSKNKVGGVNNGNDKSCC